MWGYWPLNEGSGTALRDASGNNHAGTYQSAVTWAEETTPFILGVPVPTYEPQVDWTGEAQYPVAETDDYSVDYGEGDYTSVGQYAFTLTLKNAGAKWADKTMAPKTLPFEIVKAQNEWTEGPSISATSWKKGADPVTVTAKAKFGEVVQTPATEELRELPVGKHEISVSVPATANYTGLDPVIFTVYVKDPSIPDPGPDDTTATTYTWNSAKASGLWADPVNSWTPKKSDTVHGFPANEFATATFPAGAYEVTGDENTYSIAALNIGGAVTLKGGAYETAAMTSSSVGPIVLDGASLTYGSSYVPTSAGFTLELKNGAELKSGPNVAASSARIQLKGNSQKVVANDSSITMYWDMRNAGVCSYMTNCVLTLAQLEMNAANQTAILKDCQTKLTMAATVPLTLNCDGLTQVYEGGSVEKFPSTIVVGAANGRKNVSLVFKDIKNVTFGGQVNLGWQNSTQFAVENCSIVIDNAELENAVNVTRISAYAHETYMVFKGAAPKFTQSGNNQYVQSGDTNVPQDKRGCKSGFKFVLPTSVYAAAPLQLTSNKSADCFYGNTTIAVDVSELGVPEETMEYPLVYAPNKSFTDDFLALLNYCADLPFGATLIKSADAHTISVKLLGADKLHQVEFLDGDEQTVLREAETVVDGETVSGVPTDPFHEGYVFTGWSADEGVTVLSGTAVAALPITSDMTFVAQYKTSEKTAVTDPQIATSAAYTGLENKPSIPENEGYTIDWGEGEWITVGTYTVTLKLSDPEKYVWSDGTSADRTHDFTITQAANDWVTEPTVATSWTVGETPTSDLGVATFGTATMTPDNLGELPVGAYTVTFAVAETENYSAIEKTVAVKVRPQGLGPTGDPDTEDAKRVYTWKNENATGFWYDSNRWTPDAEPSFGYPANVFGSAVFEGAVCTVTGEADDTIYALGDLTVKRSKVTLSGGAYEPNSLTFKGATPSLALADGAKVTPASEVVVQFDSDVTLAVTNATLNANVHLYNGATNFRGSFHNSTYAGNLTLSHNGTSSSDSNQSLVFSGAESELVFDADTKFANQGVDVRFENGVDMTFTSGSGKYVQVGKNSKLTFAGDNEIKALDNKSAIIICESGDNATVFFGAGSSMTTGLGLGDFGMSRYSSGLTNARTVISNATIIANNQVCMPSLIPNYIRANKAGCGVTFMGDCPRVTVGNTNVYIGKETLAKDEVLPSWRYVLPAQPYEVAPMVLKVTTASYLAFVSNTPIELDVSAVRSKGRYPLFTFKNQAPEVNIDALTAAMTAYKVRGVAQKDAKERVTLGWDAETKTIYADVASAPGFSLIVR